MRGRRSAVVAAVLGALVAVGVTASSLGGGPTQGEPPADPASDPRRTTWVLDEDPAARRDVGIPPDNVLPEPSFETGSALAEGFNRRAALVGRADAPDGVQVVEVTARRPGPFGIGDGGASVTHTLATATYTARAWVAAAPGSAGMTAWVTLRELRRDGSLVREWPGPGVALTEAYQPLEIAARPKTYDHRLEVAVVAEATAKGQQLYADAVSLTQGMPVPDGWQRSELVFDDTFGGPGYDLTDSWNFGLTDKNSLGQPWSHSGEAPYFGSGTHGYGPDCAPDQPVAEYSIPEQLTQASTGSPFNGFSEHGTGLRITVEPRVVVAAGCRYTWVSGALNTYGRGEYGGGGKTMYVQVRAQMPYADVDGRRSANGSWGSIWTLPGESNPETNVVEVDLMEGGYVLGDVDPLRVIASNLHTAEQTLYDSGIDLSAGFHTYAAEIDSATGRVRYFLDGVEYARYETGGPTGPMFLLLNLHVVQNRLADPWHSRAEVAAPMTMDVSEVQVYERPAQ